ncbi:MAG: hypothetical protein HYW24_01075 [Candidatus Aenigmarchaeota archaeon]|nr:hypothetical protein [Candidatus Aenigmarchaeota archaeon]
MNIVSEELVPNLKAKEILEEREKEAELKYEQKNSLDILKKFVKLDSKQTSEMIEALRKIEKLRDRHIMSIVNFLPEDKEDLRAVLHKEYSTLTDEEIEQVLKVVKNYI